MKMINLKTNILSVLLGGALLGGISNEASALGDAGWSYQLEEQSAFFYDDNLRAWQWIYPIDNDIWNTAFLDGGEVEYIAIPSQPPGRQYVTDSTAYSIVVSEGVIAFLTFSDVVAGQSGTFTYDDSDTIVSGWFLITKPEYDVSIVYAYSEDDVYLAQFVFGYDTTATGWVTINTGDDDDVLYVPFTENEE